MRLAKARQQLIQARERLDALLDDLEEAEKKARSGLMQNAEYWLHEQYVKGLRGDIAQARLQSRMCEQLVEEARRYLAARAIDRKMLDKLKERKKIQFVRSEQKQEQNFNDEIATIRYKAPA